MTNSPAHLPTTLLGSVISSLEKASSSPDGVEKPAALLWTDADSQWRPIANALGSSLPHFYHLGTFDPDARQGPVIWLKCIVERVLPNISPPVRMVPIIYLPGVSRQ